MPHVTGAQGIPWCCCCCCQVSSVVSDSVRPHRRQPTRLLCPWESPGKNTGVVAISFSNACMHAKSLQSCPTLCDPMDSSPPGSSVHRILQARILEWVAISFSNSHSRYLRTNNTSSGQSFPTSEMKVGQALFIFHHNTHDNL